MPLIGLEDTVGCEDVEGDARSGQLLNALNMETVAKVLELVARDC
jgi:hypothetical protein